MVAPIESHFPGLKTSPYHITSPATRDYNCIAWAAGDTTRWWWPDPGADYWPLGAPAELAIDAFVRAFETLGYVPASDAELEPGYEKIALFARADVPTHAARQLRNGRWTSKLGRLEDIEHDLHALAGDLYGDVALVLKRPVGA